jgi:hypothetical protein
MSVKIALLAVTEIQAPCFFIHAANDYSVNPGTALDARLARVGKPHTLKIYPPIGRSPDDGHDFPFRRRKDLRIGRVRLSR